MKVSSAKKKPKHASASSTGKSKAAGSKLTERAYRAQRKQIWESMNGCNCPVDAKSGERCTAQVIRCNGRMNVVTKRMHAFTEAQDRCLIRDCRGTFEHKGEHQYA